MLQVNLLAVKGIFWREDPNRWAAVLQELGKRRATKKLFPLEDLLKPCGLVDSLLALGAVEGHAAPKLLYLCYCARKALLLFEQRYPGDLRLRSAIETAERYARGQAEWKELAAAARSVKAVYRNLWKADPSLTHYIVDELYGVFVLVFECAGGRDFGLPGRTRLSRPKNFPDPDFGNYLNYSTWQALRYFIKNAVCLEDQAANMALKAKDPLETVFKGYYDLPALDALHEDLMRASGGMVEVMAEDMAGILAGNQIPALPMENLYNAAWRFMFMNICSASIHGLQKALQEALEADLTWEFRRLCRLEGEYGEVDRDF